MSVINSYSLTSESTDEQEKVKYQKRSFFTLFRPFPSLFQSQFSTFALQVQQQFNGMSCKLFEIDGKLAFTVSCESVLSNRRILNIHHRFSAHRVHI